VASRLRRWVAKLWGGQEAADADAADAPLDADAALDAGAAPGADADADAALDADADAVTAITGEELDLHTFAPREVADVVAEYVDWAAEQGLRSVRIVHGKGTGTLRRIVHSTLQRHPRVERFELAGERSGSWGATFAVLRRTPQRDGEEQARGDHRAPSGGPGGAERDAVTRDDDLDEPR
jgi:Smr domain